MADKPAVFEDISIQDLKKAVGNQKDVKRVVSACIPELNIGSAAESDETEPAEEKPKRTCKEADVDEAPEPEAEIAE